MKSFLIFVFAALLWTSARCVEQDETPFEVPQVKPTETPSTTSNPPAENTNRKEGQKTRLPAQPIFSHTIVIERGISMKPPVTPNTVEDEASMTETQKLRKELMKTAMYIQKMAYLAKLIERKEYLKKQIKKDECVDTGRMFTGEFMIMGQPIINPRICGIVALMDLELRVEETIRQVRVEYQDLLERMKGEKPEDYLDKQAMLLTEARRAEEASIEKSDIEPISKSREIYRVIGIVLLVCGVLLLILSLIIMSHRVHHRRRTTVSTHIPLQGTSLQADLMKEITH